MTEHSYGEFHFKGICEGGIESAIALLSQKLCVDIGRGSHELTDCQKLLITHGHLDHSSGIPYHASQRSLKKVPPPDVYCPPEMCGPLEIIINNWSIIEGFHIPVNIIPVDFNTEYLINSNRYFKALPAYHRVPAVGYHIYEKRKHLKEEFKHLSGFEIARMKKERDDLFTDISVPLISFSGDSRIEFVLDNPEVQNSRILFMECTYLDAERPVSRAREWGHTHLFEIRDNAEVFKNIEVIYLTHISPRYSSKMVHHSLRTFLPPELQKKIIPYMHTRT
jgi:ribonuclease Z